MFGYVYITTNLINGKQYIGKRSLPEFDTKYLGSGKLLKRAIKKYGKENFKCEVIKWCETEEELNYYERYYIKEYDAQKSDMFYNISEGGDWGNVTNGMTEEEYIAWKAKISPLGRHHSEETKKKMSLARIGIKYSEETIQKMRENNSGKNNPMYGTHWTEEFFLMKNFPIIPASFWNPKPAPACSWISFWKNAASAWSPNSSWQPVI